MSNCMVTVEIKPQIAKAKKTSVHHRHPLFPYLQLIVYTFAMKIIAILHLFCALLCGKSNAFQCSSRRNPVKGTSLQMTVLSYGGKKKDFKPGSPLKSAASALGVKPKYSCKKGDCGSCTLSVGGQRIKACVGKVPPEPRLKSLQEKGLEIR